MIHQSIKSIHSISIVVLSLLVTLLSILWSPVQSIPSVICLVIAVALIGVPHGGLDHLTGRELLQGRSLIPWQFIFFPIYLLAAAIVATGWILLPLVTAISFFLISAWHFGIEEERTKVSHPLADHLGALAIGGLVIWVPALMQTDRIMEILRAIVPADVVSVPNVVGITRFLAFLLVPIAICLVARDFFLQKWSQSLRNVCFLLLFAVADPLVSFGIYFCGWHSIRGLLRLANTYQKTALQLAVATAPLSFGAIGLTTAAMLIMSSGQNISDAMVQTLFVGLAAIAVPHLLLHGPVSDFFSKDPSSNESLTRNLEVVS